jgi:TonB family protein
MTNKYKFYVMIVMITLFGCSGSVQNQKNKSGMYINSDNPKFQARDISRKITYQFSDTAQVALWDTINHFPMANMTSPTAVNKVSPEYPSIAIRAGLEGKILVKVQIGKDGNPIKVIVLLASAELFVAPVRDAAKQWKFNPPLKDGQPQEFWATLDFNFIFSNGTAKVILPE